MRTFHIHQILIPIDFSETSMLALDHAVNMAKLCKAEITLINVYEPLINVSAIDISMLSFQSDVDNRVQEAAQEKLDAIAAEVQRSAACTVHSRLEIGRVYSTVVDVAKEIKADLIILGTHGVSGFQEFLMGSNAFRIAQAAPCPVLSIQQTATKTGFQKIVLPIDNSPTSRQKVIFAVEMARMYNSTIHLVALYTSNDHADVHSMNIKIGQVEKFLQDRNINFTTVSLKGSELAKLTENYAKEIDADLIMIMTEQEENVSGLWFGAQAQQLVNHSKIPVMSISPEDVSDNLVAAVF